MSNCALDRLTETKIGSSPVWICHSVRSLVAFSKANMPSSLIRSEFSAIGMNSDGEMLPRLGCSQRINASKPAISASTQAHDRLIDEAEFLALDGAAQVGFEL